MKTYPQFPEDWKDAKQTLYRNFYLKSSVDIEILKDLVKTHISDKGNNGVLRARLLGILNSYFSRANELFWTKHYHPYTYKLILFWKHTGEWFARTFNTCKFRNNVELCNIASSVVDEILAEEKSK
jgi:hypothetical protein